MGTAAFPSLPALKPAPCEPERPGLLWAVVVVLGLKRRRNLPSATKGGRIPGTQMARPSKHKEKPHRINSQIPQEAAAKMQELMEIKGLSQADLLTLAIEELHGMYTGEGGPEIAAVIKALEYIRHTHPELLTPAAPTKTKKK